MDFNRCLASPKTSIKRCRNYSGWLEKSGFCSVHEKKEKTFKIQHYNGSIYTFKENTNKIISFTPPIYLWKIMNRQLSKQISKSERKILEEQSKLIRCGSQNKVVEAFLKTKCFDTKGEVVTFFQKKKKKLKKENLEKARHFLGVIYYFKRKNIFLKKIQLNIRVKLAYEKHMDIIIKIQRWVRYRIWFKKLPVKPKSMRKYYIPNINKIIVLQRNIRKFIKTKVKHSHGCPYSLEDYWEIPKKHRIVYKHKEGNHFHWRYYNILWLHNDFMEQTMVKRYVVEPVTKIEFPVDFVENVAKKIWYLTRKENDYLNNEGGRDYDINNDWKLKFNRRSLYRFSLMLFDLCDELNLEVKNINNWRKTYFKLKYQIFYLEAMPTLRNIAMGMRHHNLEDTIYYLTRDMFRADILFTETEMLDEIAGEAIYGILRILLMSKRDPLNYDLFKSVIKDYFQTRLIE